ncbi:MAG: hypothetical protein R3E60_00610 [Alphaproteobacteria bacterium]
MRKRSSVLSSKNLSEETLIEIEDLGRRGDGVVRINGQALHVPLTLPGDQLKLRYDLKTLRPAEFSLIKPSALRVHAPCPHFSACGGCQLQHFAELPYRQWKRRLVIDAVMRAGGNPSVVTDIVSVPTTSRRRAVLTAKKYGEHLRVGFYRRHEHVIEDMTQCLILAPPLANLLPALRASLSSEIDLPEMRITATATERGVDLIIDAERPLDLRLREKFAQFAHDEDLARISWQQNLRCPSPSPYAVPQL